MCGFFGEFSNDLLNSEDFRTNLQRSFKRGPDQQEIWSDGKLYQVGFNRLSILDLTENGKQPLLSPSGRYSLVINGEIYNYKELKRKYNIADSQLRSTSDSEVISQLLDQLPVETLVKELNGMYAMAVYDCKLKSLTLLRDFAGIKPLYFGMIQGTVVFASQFDQIFQHPKFRNQLQIDVNGLYDYASLGYMATERTVFKNIRQLQPGELVQFDSPATRNHRQFCKFRPDGRGIFEESSNSTYEKLDDILGRVVQDQLVADVPVGLFLSGGVDSPIIAAYAKKYKSDITAYTIGVSESHMDESAQAGAYAKTLNLRHKIIRFEEQELLRYNDEHFNSLTAPFGDYSSLPTYLVTQIAHANNTVMLSGDGGDELFWGYPRFLNVVNHYKWFSYPISIRARGAGLLRRTGRRISYGVSNFDKINEWVLAQQCHNSPRSLTGLMPNQTFSPELLDYYTPPNKLASKEELLQWLRWNEFYGHLQRVLAKVDLTSMGNSLEVRVPFLDKRVIDFAWQLKPGLGSNHQNPKLLLKQVLKRQLGNISLSDKKRGFTIPVRKWLRKELKQDLQNHLLEIPLFGDTIWNKPELEKSLKKFFEEDQGNEWGIWILYAMQKWAKRYQLV